MPSRRRARSRRFDSVALLEAMYSPRSEPYWLEELSSTFKPWQPDAVGAGGITVQLAGSVNLQTWGEASGRRGQHIDDRVRRVCEVSDARRSTSLDNASLGKMSKLLGEPRVAEVARQSEASTLGFKDVVGAWVSVAPGSGLRLACLLPRIRRSTKVERGFLRSLVSHLRAAAQMRDALLALGAEPLEQTAAVFTPDGRPAELHEDATWRPS